jgi:hypothetical protein
MGRVLDKGPSSRETRAITIANPDQTHVRDVVEAARNLDASLILVMRGGTPDTLLESRHLGGGADPLSGLAEARPSLAHTQLKLEPDQPLNVYYDERAAVVLRGDQPLIAPALAQSPLATSSAVRALFQSRQLLAFSTDPLLPGPARPPDDRRIVLHCEATGHAVVQWASEPRWCGIHHCNLI